MRLLLRIALTHLRSRRRQTLVSVGGVAMGVGFAVATAALMQGFQEDFVQRVIDASPHIVMKDEYRSPPKQPVQMLYGGGAIDLRSQKPRDEVRGIKRARRAITVLSKWPGLHVAPTLQGQLILRYGSKDESASIVGIDPDKERNVTKIEKDMIEGTLDDLKTTSNGIILGNGLARKLGIKVGDTLTAVSPTGATLKMKVVGIQKTGIVAIDDTQAYTLLKKAQVLQNRINVINEIRMRLDNVDRASTMAARIERRFGYKTESWKEANEGVFGIFVIQNAIMYSITGAILIVACFGIFNVISTVIYEKYRDIAILKSIGFPERDIRRIFLIEGVTLGAVGSIAGWALGYGLTLLLASIRFDAAGMVEVQSFILKYSWWHYAITGVAAISAATLAAYLPARRAAAIKPVDIIRGAA